MSQTNSTPTVVRTGRGLTVGGSRLTLYTLMDRLKEEWPPHLIRDWYDLTDQQMQDILPTSKPIVKKLKPNTNRFYVKPPKRNGIGARKTGNISPTLPPYPPPGKEAIYAKLKAEKNAWAWHDHLPGRSRY